MLKHLWHLFSFIFSILLTCLIVSLTQGTVPILIIVIHLHKEENRKVNPIFYQYVVFLCSFTGLLCLNSPYGRIKEQKESRKDSKEKMVASEVIMIPVDNPTIYDRDRFLIHEFPRVIKS